MVGMQATWSASGCGAVAPGAGAWYAPSMNLTRLSQSEHRDFVLQNLDQLAARRILVVGDVGLDEYVLGAVRRISPEAPVPVLEVDREERRLGLAGNVAQNVVSLGGSALLLSVVGEDSARGELQGLLQTAGVQTDFVVDPSRPTTRKMRVMADHHHLVRVDYERRSYLPQELYPQMLQRYAQHLDQVDGVIIQDYAKGMLSEDFIQSMVRLARDQNKRVLVDPHRTTPLKFYRGADVMTPNWDEALALAGVENEERQDPETTLAQTGARLLEALGSAQVVITRGPKGMRLLEKSSDGVHGTDLPTFAREVFDVTGAGDTVIAAMALGWLSGWSLSQACVLANAAAGVVVAQVGCVPCTRQQLAEFLSS